MSRRIRILMPAVFAVAAVATLSGCTVRRAQVATQTSLTSVADGVQAAADIVARSVPAAEPGEGVEAYRERAAAHYQAATAYDSSREALLALQAAQDAWVISGDLPDNWPALCSALGDAVGHLISSIEVAGVDLPAALSVAPGAVSSACSIAASFIEEDSQ